MQSFTTLGIRSDGQKLEILDQQMLPHEENWIVVEGPDHMVEIIKQLKVRGAPAIGVAAAMTLAQFAESGVGLSDFLEKAALLRESRPTAVNLMIAVDRMTRAANDSFTVESIVTAAELIRDEDIELCRKMGEVGANVVDANDVILTHCNTGGLATAGAGTALAVITTSHQQGKNIHVYVDETRPLLQGGRLTTWELEKAGVPYTLNCDNMAGQLMSMGKINKVFVGSDRIARNGDFANKIGTYSLAVLAYYHRVPFYVVAPSTTVDMEIETGAEIPIEQRKEDEVRGVAGAFGEVIWSPKSAEVYNPAFDVTPAQLITGFIIDDQYFSSEQAGQLKIAEYVKGVN